MGVKVVDRRWCGSKSRTVVVVVMVVVVVVMVVRVGVGMHAPCSKCGGGKMKAMSRGGELV